MEINKIWHISDTHGYHELLDIPDDVEMVIHSGDFSNYFNIYKNEPEALNFLHWYGALNIKYKILIAGNHDAYAAGNSTKFKEWCHHYNIIYLMHESIVVEGIKIFGSPYTPTFGNWHFNKAAHKLDKLWSQIPNDTDVVVVHGPPKGVLDSVVRHGSNIESCGCKSLRNHILNRLNSKYVLFGHIHNNEWMINAGTTKLSIKDTIFSNGSIVTDGRFGKLTSNGNILKYDRKEI